MLERIKAELNIGIEHINRSAKKKNAVKMVLPCTCRLRCFDKVSEDLRKKNIQQKLELRGS